MKDERYLSGFTFLNEGALMKKSLLITLSICFVLVLGSASQIHAQSVAGITGLAGFETGFQVIARWHWLTRLYSATSTPPAQLFAGEITRMITRDHLSVLVGRAIRALSTLLTGMHRQAHTPFQSPTTSRHTFL